MAQLGGDAIMAHRVRGIMQLPYDAPEVLTPASGTFRLAEIRDHKRRYAAGAAG